jgi:hypothetical protein
MLYNIPAVFTSVIDKSYIQPLLVEGRSVLIAGFSKYGEDKFYEFGDAETMTFTLGELDIDKYGLGLMYGLGALTNTRNVIFKRLMPEDAKVANVIFMSDGTTRTDPDIIDSSYLETKIDQDPGISPVSIEVKEAEFRAEENQGPVIWEYNPSYLSVFVAGNELSEDEYRANDGTTIEFTNPNTVIADKIINLYTVIDKRTDIPANEEIRFIQQEEVASSAGQTEIYVTNGYKDENDQPVSLWITVNGLVIQDADFTANDGVKVIFHFGGPGGDGLSEFDVVRIHGIVDNSSFDNVYLDYEVSIPPEEDGATKLTLANYLDPSLPAYNPLITAVSVNGFMLGEDDYTADDGYNLFFAFPLKENDIVKMRTIIQGDDIHMWGALIAKAQGNGYNDLSVQFRPAPDIERQYSDEEGDLKYRFNFLKAVIIEEIPAGKRVVSEEFVVSLIDQDPESGMPIVSTVTGENLYIKNKFGGSNEFIYYYPNESLLPELYKNLSIDDLTTDPITGEKGKNRFILKNHISNPIYERKKINMELIVNSMDEYEWKATSIEGKDEIYTIFHDPSNGEPLVFAIRLQDGELQIYENGTASQAIEELFIEGVNNFYKVIIVQKPGGNNGYELKILPHETIRHRLYNTLLGGHSTAWEMESGTNGKNLIKDGRLNLGVSTSRYGVIHGGISEQNAKQLLLYFYETNEVIHEVLYPELDFDYVPDWTDDYDVQAAIISLVDDIGFSFAIVSLSRSTSVEMDYKKRTEILYQSSYNSAIYSGQHNDNHYMTLTGKTISCPSSYYAMINHLKVDTQISITEPMANIVKGQLPVAGAKLSFIAKSKDIEKLRMKQVNTIIKETDGIYYIDQLTAYKAASKLTRINVIKPIHRMRKDLPRLLKDLLQHKATSNIILEAKSRTEKYMARWQVRDDNITDGIFSEITVTPVFIPEQLTLVISIAITPIGTIEKILIPITVY